MELFSVLRTKWMHFDSNASSSVPAPVFLGILRNLPQSILMDLGMAKYDARDGTEAGFIRFLSMLDLPVQSSETTNFTFPRGFQVTVEYKRAQRALALRLFRVHPDNASEVERLLHLKNTEPDRNSFKLHHYYAAKKLTLISKRSKAVGQCNNENNNDPAALIVRALTRHASHQIIKREIIADENPDT